ncbi:hypothetical protein REPUB_Repub12eG0084800 [Reevesia pubescens]
MGLFTTLSDRFKSFNSNKNAQNISIVFTLVGGVAALYSLIGKSKRKTEKQKVAASMVSIESNVVGLKDIGRPFQEFQQQQECPESWSCFHARWWSGSFVFVD